jgi:hypothetical protein
VDGNYPLFPIFSSLLSSPLCALIMFQFHRLNAEVGWGWESGQETRLPHAYVEPTAVSSRSGRSYATPSVSDWNKNSQSRRLYSIDGESYSTLQAVVAMSSSHPQSFLQTGLYPLLCYPIILSSFLPLVFHVSMISWLNFPYLHRVEIYRTKSVYFLPFTQFPTYLPHPRL